VGVGVGMVVVVIIAVLVRVSVAREGTASRSLRVGCELLITRRWTLPTLVMLGLCMPHQVINTSHYHTFRGLGPAMELGRRVRPCCIPHHTSTWSTPLRGQ
jgi:hypothetical protein